MVHGLTAQLGGGFGLSSDFGRGTRADLYLPVAEASSSADSPMVREPVKAINRTLSILLVDDEEIVRVATAEMIRDLGHKVTEAGDGGEALAILEDSSFDALVTDYKMPRMDGGELIRRVRDLHPDMGLLLITGYTGVTDETLEVASLPKPFGQSELAAALAELFKQDDNVIQFAKPKRS
jgi:CheY-like chemotaxis protein